MATNIESEPSKKTSKSEERWTENLDSRYSVLSDLFRTASDEMTADDLREFSKLQLLKQGILSRENEEKIAKLQIRRKKKKKKGKSTSQKTPQQDSDEESSTSENSATSEEENSSSEASKHDTETDSQTFWFSPSSKSSKKKERPQPQQQPDEAEMKRQITEFISETVNKRFFGLVDQQQQQSQHGFVTAPKTGTKSRLSDSLEKRLKNEAKGVFYSDRQSKSHSLAFLLNIHQRFSELGKLTSKASIALLQRYLQGAAFTLSESLKSSDLDINLLYKTLQSTFRDLPDDYTASKHLERFVDAPDLVNLTKVSMKIFELSTQVHQSQDKNSRPRSITVTATTSFLNFIQRYYPRNNSSKIRQHFLQWQERNPDTKNPVASFFELASIASQELEGILPSYARNLPGRRPEPPKPRMPYQQAQRVETAEEQDFDLTSVTSWDALQEQDIEDSDFEMQSVLAAEPGKFQPKYRCLLCGLSKHANGLPGMFKFCDIYPGLQPVKFRQACCSNRHPVLPQGMKCKSPFARHQQQLTQEPDKPKVQVYS